MVSFMRLRDQVFSSSRSCYRLPVDGGALVLHGGGGHLLLGADLHAVAGQQHPGDHNAHGEDPQGEGDALGIAEEVGAQAANQRNDQGGDRAGELVAFIWAMAQDWGWWQWGHSSRKSEE